MTVPAADAAPVCILRWRLKSHKAQYGTPTALRSAGVCSGIMSPGSSRSLNLRSRTIARARKQVPKPLAQNIFFCTLPFALRGSSATKIARFGNLNLASLFCERLPHRLRVESGARADTTEAGLRIIPYRAERGAGRTTRRRASCAPSSQAGARLKHL